MRVTARKLVNLWLARKSGSVGNSSVEVAPDGDATFRLHGHPIVRVRTENGTRKVEFTFAGWPTNTTRSRVNDLLHGIGCPVTVYQKAGEQFVTRWEPGSERSDRPVESLHEWYLAGTLVNVNA